MNGVKIRLVSRGQRAGKKEFFEPSGTPPAMSLKKKV
jgi:hypothetical protein